MVQDSKIIEYAILEIRNLLKYAPVDQIDIENAINLRLKLIEYVAPMIELTEHGLCMTWSRNELIFENGLIYYFRYDKDRIFSWKPVEIGGGVDEGLFHDGLLDKLKRDLSKCQ